MPSPGRIVSLVPSLTELVVHLGRGAALVGRTRFCTEPPDAVATVPIIGGTKNPRVERIVALHPDLVIANREENRREDITALRERGLDVLLTDPCDVEGALAMVADLGTRLGTPGRAADLVARTRAALAADAPPDGRRPRVCVFIWRDPWMALGSGTYAHDLLERCGAANALGDLPRYPEVSLADVAARKPDLVILPDEPYPFSAEDAPSVSQLGRVVLIDGRQLFWYGPRMPAAVASLRRALAVP